MNCAAHKPKFQTDGLIGFTLVGIHHQSVVLLQF